MACYQKANTKTDCFADKFILLILVQNYDIAIARNQPLDYKMFHRTDSDQAKMELHGGEVPYPWRYPFCDVSVYKYNNNSNTFVAKREAAREWWPRNQFDASIADKTNGTYLKKFGEFHMRVFIHSEHFLERSMGKRWRYIAKTHNFNHKTLRELKEVKFMMPQDLHGPALPFS